MIDRYRILIAVLGMAGSAIQPIAVAQQADPNSPRYKGVVALSDFLTSQGDKALEKFVAERVSRQLRDSIGQERLAAALAQLRSGFAGTRRSNARPEGPFAAYIAFSNGKSISFEMESDPPHRFVRIGSIGGEGSPSNAAPCCATPQQTPQQTSSVASLTELDKKLRAEAAKETFSGVVLVAKDGKPIFLEAYGYADKKAGVLNRKDTQFNLGSINKLFTMVAVYQLLDAGKLSRDDTIGKYLPQFPPSVADSVTVGHLLDHRSGWAAYWDNPAWKARRAELRSLDDYMAFIKDIPLDFEPGTRKQYSNTGYEVLGAIVQKASGQSYYDYVRDHIYKPAGMMNTDAYVRGGSTPNMAIGYAGGGYAQDNLSMLSRKGTAAGGGMSTAADMMRFAKALDEGTLIPKKHSNRLRGGGFAGGGPGVNATLEMSVAGNHTIVVLSNFDPPTAGRVGREIRQILRADNDAETGTNRYRIGVGLELGGDGISVSFLVPDAPGERAGLKPDDVIVALNGKPIANDPIAQLDALLTKPDPIQLKVRRGDALKEITVTPEPTSATAAQPASSGAAQCETGGSTASGTPACCAAPSPSPVAGPLGVMTARPTDDLVRSMKLGDALRREGREVWAREGRLITQVVKGSPADKAGLERGDVILQLDNNRIYSQDAFDDFFRINNSDSVNVTIKRAGETVETHLTVEMRAATDPGPQASTAFRWNFVGLGQLPHAIRQAKEAGKRVLVGLSGSELCCAGTRFESAPVTAILNHPDVIRASDPYVRILIRRPLAYWFIQDHTVATGVTAQPSGVTLSDGTVVPMPGLTVLGDDGKIATRIGLSGSDVTAVSRALAKPPNQ